MPDRQRDYLDEQDFVKVRRRPSWPTALAMAMAILLLILSFYWVFVRLEPALDDVVERTDLTPTTLESPAPTASP